ncbi:bifunctional adenosylcobinamide kinase/adenosylcobinamide-phosphate guanylyltransferase [Paenochrobactrum sp. BZR 588]|uniref:bifunctional adenosylcobinamide kinase/adenosylcobinamide-phosphate guanylyltransferase n=1 Tax=Paenochrobactrum TaxID=999488 RepID=UPI0035BC8EE8
MPSAKITLVLGGARSGKSKYAENCAENSGLQPFYIATGRAYDDEMRSRINLHQDRRGLNWTTVEEPLDLADALLKTAAPNHFVLVDCLTLWVTNLMMAERDIEAETARLLETFPKTSGEIFFVSNEVGLGIVPDNRMAREFRDYAGFLHQRVAEKAHEVYFMAAGLSLKMKG